MTKPPRRKPPSARPELHWPGKRPADFDEVAPELRVAERYGAGGNRLILGDNAAVMRSLIAQRASIDLITVDPPFDSGQVMTAPGARKNRTGPVVAYLDTWGGCESPYQWLYERLTLMYHLLASTGSIYVHVDYRAHPVARLMMEEIFGANRLVNDIVWSYRSGGGSRKSFGRKHDNLLLFSKSPAYTFNTGAMRVPYDAVIAEKRRSSFHPGGKVAGDVWDISRPANHAAEWVGYPTQKPEKLLEREVLASSNSGGLVADFFCGSGTAGVVAERLGRRWVLGDVSPVAVLAARLRLLAMEPRPAFEVLEAGASGEAGRLSAKLTGRLELTGWEPGGLDELEFWGYQAGASREGPFEPEWYAFRTRQLPDIPFEVPAPLASSGPVRVRAIDRHGRAGETWLDPPGRVLRP